MRFPVVVLLLYHIDLSFSILSVDSSTVNLTLLFLGRYFPRPQFGKVIMQSFLKVYNLVFSPGQTDFKSLFPPFTVLYSYLSIGPWSSKSLGFQVPLLVPKIGFLLFWGNFTRFVPVIYWTKRNIFKRT